MVNYNKTLQHAVRMEPETWNPLLLASCLMFKLEGNSNGYLKTAEETLGSSCAGKFRNKVDHGLLVQLKFSYKPESVC